MISAREESSRLANLLRREHAALADFLVALADFDRERRWLELGHASLFYFLHRELGLSKGAAFYRKTAAELIQKYPEVVEPLRDGRLCLTSVVELAKVVTPENRTEVLPRFFHRSKAEAKAVSAEISPAVAPPRRDVVTSMGRAEPTGVARLAFTDAPLALVHPDEPRDRNQLLVAPAAPRSPAEPAIPAPDAPGAPARRDQSEPLTADLSRLHVTVSRGFLAKLEAARAALSHSHPGATSHEILEAGLDLLLAQAAKRKGQTEKPRRVPPPAKPLHVPAHVKRAVWERDGGCCQWKRDGGAICGSRHRVEIDHIDPRGRGGPATVENLRLLCRVHNQYAARLAYGAWMDRFTTQGRRRTAPGRPNEKRPPGGGRLEEW
jgi:hypothetical protein